MKKNDLKIGDIVRFNCNACIGSINTTRYDSNSGSIKDMPDLGYGESYPTIAKDSEELWKVIEEINETVRKYFVVIESISLPGYTIRMSNCGVLDLVEDSEITSKVKLTERESRALKLRKGIKNNLEKLNKLKCQIQIVEEQIEQDTFTASALERYDSDDQALAAMLSEVLKTNGNEEEITKILRKTGVTAKL